MTTAKWIPAAAAMFGVIALMGLAQNAPDLSGTWIGQTEIPNVGTDEVTLALKKAEKGYGGTMSDSQSVINPNTEIRDAAFDGEKISFILPLADGSLITIQLVVAGDRMTGHWEHPAGSTDTIELLRKKDKRP